MVRIGAFDFRLVEATSKVKFQEHHHSDGKVYIEVEPDAEYFLSFQKVAKTETDVSISYSVDDQKIGGATNMTKQCIHSEPQYKGIRSHENGISTHRSFIFKKPKVTEGGEDGSLPSNPPALLMGKVEFEIHQIQYTENKSRNNSSSFTAKYDESKSVHHPNATELSKKKALRSAKGQHVVSKHNLHMSKTARVRHLDTVTLHYCTALGLMEVGVLEKPSNPWVLHRMRYPADASDGDNGVQQADENGVIDLAINDSDSDDEE